MRYHVIDQWKTVASRYPRGSVGEWSMSTRVQEPGIYRMQARDTFYYQSKPIDLTVLKEGERAWFTDEPRQLYALAEVGLFRAHGRVVVGGLGLGLIHHLLRRNPQVTDVVTIERARELGQLVWPWVPGGLLRIGDFYEELPKLTGPVDTIITDFIFGTQNDATWEQLKETERFCKRYFPLAQFLEHGYQERMDAETVAVATPSSPLVPETMGYDVVRIVH